MRLDEVEGSIIASFWLGSENRQAIWYSRSLQLTVNAATSTVMVKDSSELPSALRARAPYRGRNFGIFHSHGKWRLLLWPAQPLVVGPPAPKSRREPPRHLVSYLRFAHGKKRALKLHPNTAPILLSSGELLIVAHTHLPPSRQGNPPHTFAHAFLLTEAQPPWRVKAQSRPWCIPAADSPRVCESIQFISSSFLIGKPGHQQLVLGYGANDCDSWVVQLPLAEVLEATRGGAVTTGLLVDNVPGSRRDDAGRAAGMRKESNRRAGSGEGRVLERRHVDRGPQKSEGSADLRAGQAFALKIARNQWPHGTGVRPFRIPNSEWVIDLDSVLSAVNSSSGCLAYAFGVASSDPYTEYLAQTGCHVFAFDPTVNHSTAWMPNVTFHPWGIRNSKSTVKWTFKGYGAVTGDILPLPDIIRRLGHDDGRPIHALKVDCEGCEWELFHDLEKSNLTNPILNLATEFHFASTLGVVGEQDVENLRFADELLSRRNCAVVNFRRNKGFPWDRHAVAPPLLAAGLPNGVCCYEVAFKCEPPEPLVAAAARSSATPRLQSTEVSH